MVFVFLCFRFARCRCPADSKFVKSVSPRVARVPSTIRPRRGYLWYGVLPVWLISLPQIIGCSTLENGSRELEPRDRRPTPDVEQPPRPTVRQIDGARHSWNERDHCRLVALADDAQGPVASVEAEVLDIGGTGLADSESVEAQEGRQGGMVVVVALRREQEGAELAPVESAAFARVDLGASDVLGRVGADPPVDMGEAVEAADCGQPEGAAHQL